MRVTESTTAIGRGGGGGSGCDGPVGGETRRGSLDGRWAVCKAGGRRPHGGATSPVLINVSFRNRR